MDIRCCVFAFMFLLSACSSISGVPNRSADVASELESLKSYFSPSVVAAYQSKTTDEEKMAYRDEVISARVRAIDLNFNEFIQGISAENKRLNIGADSTVLFLGAAGAVSTVSSTQAILSATSATVTGVKSSIDKNAYYDATLNALVSQMLANRKTVLVSIYAGMEHEVKDYPLMRALIDVEDYFQAGTIIGAVSEITKEAGKQKAKADEKIADIVISGKYTRDNPSKTLELFLMPDGNTINTNNQERIESWLKSKNLNISIATLIYNPDFSEERLSAIQDLNIH